MLMHKHTQALTDAYKGRRRRKNAWSLLWVNKKINEKLKFSLTV